MRARVLLAPVNRSDVRMIAGCERGGLAFESRAPIGALRKLRGQHLQSDIALELHVAGFPNFTHPTAADRGEDFVVAYSLTRLHRSRNATRARSIVQTCRAR